MRPGAPEETTFREYVGAMTSPLYVDERHDDVLDELTGHLEDAYHSARHAGAARSEAAARAIREFGSLERVRNELTRQALKQLAIRTGWVPWSISLAVALDFGVAATRFAVKAGSFFPTPSVFLSHALRGIALSIAFYFLAVYACRLGWICLRHVRIGRSRILPTALGLLLMVGGFGVWAAFPSGALSMLVMDTFSRGQVFEWMAIWRHVVGYSLTLVGAVGLIAAFKLTQSTKLAVLG